MARIIVPRAIIGLAKENSEKLLGGSEIISTKFGANPTLFGAAPVTKAKLDAAIADLDTKHQATKTNKGAVGARDASADALWMLLETNCTFVNGLCHAQPDQALSIIQQSGYQVEKVTHRAKQLVELFATTNAGEVRIEVNASMLLPPSGKVHTKKTFLFRHALDGKTFVLDDPQPVARTLLTGLPAMTEISVQVAVKDSKGQSKWSQSFTITLLK